MSDWRDRAACRDEDPELFFPVGTGLLAQEQTAEAKAVCHRCPVIFECLDQALDAPEAEKGSGIWGGMSDDERRSVLSGRAHQQVAA